MEPLEGVNLMIYLDHAATTPMRAVAREQLRCSSEQLWGNASALYGPGRAARAALDQARARAAELLGAQSREVLFTSGGTESNNWAMTAPDLRPGDHIVLSAVEHPSVLQTAASLARQGVEVTYLPVDSAARVNPGDVQRALRPQTRLVSVMMANNETGTVEPVQEIAALVRQAGALFHTDAVQAAGHLPISFETLGADFLSLSAHKFGGPKGQGMLLIRRGVRVLPFHHGGEQERGLRAGTEDVPGILSMVAALEEANSLMQLENEHILALRRHLEAGIHVLSPEALISAEHRERLPGHVHVIFPGIHPDLLLLRLDMAGICASSGSACTAGIRQASHVCEAMHAPQGAALRLSLGKDNTQEEISITLEKLGAILRDLKKQA